MANTIPQKNHRHEEVQVSWELVAKNLWGYHNDFFPDFLLQDIADIPIDMDLWKDKHHLKQAQVHGCLYPYLVAHPTARKWVITPVIDVDSPYLSHVNHWGYNLLTSRGISHQVPSYPLVI